MSVIEREYLEKVVVVAEGATINITDFMKGDFEVYRSSEDLIFVDLDSGDRVRFVDIITLSFGENAVKILNKDGEVIDYLSTELEFEGTVDIAETSALGIARNGASIGGVLNYGNLLGYMSQGLTTPKGALQYSGAVIREEVEPIVNSVISTASNLVADEDEYHSPVTSRFTPSNQASSLRYEALGSTKTDYGKFTLNNDGSYSYKLNDNSKVQSLREGQKVVETMKVKVSDPLTGEESIQDVDVTIIGRNDNPEVDYGASIVSGAAKDIGTSSGVSPFAASAAPGKLSTVATGNISASDIDGDDIFVEVVSPPKYGTIVFDGTRWTFTINTKNPDVKALGEGQILSDLAGVTIKDSYGGETFVMISLKVEGAQDAPVVTSNSTLFGEVYEDIGTGTKASGIVRGSDLDAGDTVSFEMVNPNQTGKYGSFMLNADGTWNYTLDNKNAAVNALNDGDTLVETFRVYATDGADRSEPVTIRVVIYGNSDVPQLESVVLSIQEDSIKLLSGTLNNSSVFDGHNFQLLSGGHYGQFTILPEGGYSYLLNTNHIMVDSLAKGDVLYDYITVEVVSPNGKKAQAQVTIRIVGQNDGPTIDLGATRASAVIEEDAAIDMVSGVIVGKDVDKGDILSYTMNGTGKYGKFTIDAKTGEWTYTLNNKNGAVQALGKGDSLTDKITITVKDKDGASVTKEVVVTIKGNDEAPYIDQGADGSDLIVEVTEDDAFLPGKQYHAEGDLKGIVVDPEGGVMTFKALGASQYGTLKLNADGTYTYVLNNSSSKVQSLAEGQTITETIAVIVTDEGGNQLQTTITITITGKNDAPTINVGATDDSAVIVEDDTAPVTGKIIGQDMDDNASLTYTLKGDADGDGVVLGRYGTLTLDASGRWSYVLDNTNSTVQGLNANSRPLTDVIIVIVTDEHGAKVEQEITITIKGADEKPIIDQEAAGSHIIPATEDDDAEVTGTLIDYIVDPEATPLTFKLMAGSKYGTLTLNADGSYSFKLDNSLKIVQEISKGQVVSEVIPVIVTDLAGNVLNTTVTIQITGTNDAPSINVGSTIATGTAAEDVYAAITGKVVGQDIDQADVLNYSLKGAEEGKNEKEGVYGKLVLRFDGTWEYYLDNTKNSVQALNEGETRTDSFTVIVDDGNGGTVEQKVVVTVVGTDEAPILNIKGEGDATIEATEDSTAAVTGTLTDSIEDLDGDPLTFTLLGSSKYGTLTLNADGTYRFVLDNSLAAVQALSKGQKVTEVVPILVSDGVNELSTTVSIVITGVNDAPIINVGSTIATGNAVEDNAATVAGKIVGQDIDQADKLSYKIQGDTDADGKFDGTYGKLILKADGTWEYKLDHFSKEVQALNEGETRTDSFTVIVSDGNGGSVSQVVTITVLGTNEAPILDIKPNGKDTINAFEDAADPVVGDMNDYVKDPEGEALQFALQGSSNYGTLTLNPDGTYSYRIDNSLARVQELAAGQVVVETIPVLVTDSAGNQLNTYIKVKITGQNDAPTINIGATDDAAVIVENDTAPATGKIIGQDVDNGDKLTYSLKGDTDGDNIIKGEYGTLTLDASGRWSYVLDNSNATVQALNANSKPLTDTIIVIVTDSKGATVEQKVTITIKGADGKPIIDQDAAGSHVIDATEDVHNDSDNTVEGTLKDYIVDPEAKPLDFKLMAGSKYGTLILNSDGSYEFKLDNSLKIVQELSKGQVATEVIPIMVEDEGGNVLSTTITIRITGTNDAPTVDVAGSILTGTAVEDNHNLITAGKVVGADVDQADKLVYKIKGVQDGVNNIEGTYGELILNADGSWEYKLDHSKVQSLSNGDREQDRFTVVIDDQNGGKKETTIVIDVLGTNEGPIINVNGDGSSLIQATEDVSTPISGDLTGDITSPDGDTLSFRLLANSKFGILTLNSDGSYTFILDNSLATVQSLSKGQKITEVLPILVSDGVNELNTTITIEVTGANDAPTINVGSTIATGVAVEDNAAPVTGKIVGSDIDQADTLEYTIKGDTDGDGKMKSSYGELILNKDGKWEYKLNHSAVQSLSENETYTDTFTVVVNDGNGGTVEQDVVVTIMGTNEAPVLDIKPNGKDTISIIEDATDPVTGDMNDYVKDPEGEALKFALQGSSLYGTLKLNSDGSYSYTIDNSLSRVQELAAGQVVVETIPVLVTDTAGNQLNTYIQVKITGQNDAPIIDLAGTDSKGMVVEDSFMRIATGKVIGQDVDAGDKLSYSIESIDDGNGGNSNVGKYGTFTIDAKTGSWTYVLKNNHADVQALDADDDPLYDTITVTVTDSNGATVTQVVTITIMGQDEPNTAPVVTGGTSGAITEDAAPNSVAGTVTYTDADGDIVTFSAVGRPAYGDFVIDSSTGAWTYTLNNQNTTVDALGKGETLTDYVTVELSDGNGGTVKKNVEITITGANDAPKFTALTDVDETILNTANQASGQIAISDVDVNDSHTYSLKDGTNTGTTLGSDYGSFTVDSNGKWTYTLDKTNTAISSLPGGSTLTDTITVIVSDGNATIEKEITVTITGTNTAPTIDGGDTGTITENGVVNQSNELTGKILASDNEGDKLTYKIVDKDGAEVTVLEGKYGTLEISATGSWTYTLNNNNADVDKMTAQDTLRESFDIVVSDGLASTDGVINITIKGANDRPIISSSYENVSGSVSDATPAVKAEGTIVASDVDTGDRFTFTVTNDGNFGTGIDFGDAMSVPDANGYGTFTITSSGAWTYTLKQPLHADIKALGKGESLDIKLYVKAIDEAGNALSNNQSVVTITINGSNDAPTITTITDKGKVTEDGNISDSSDTGGKAEGTIVYADLDVADDHSVTIKEGTNAGKTEYTSTYGTFKLVANVADNTESWEYVLDSSKVQHLREGETVTETMTIVIDDGNGGKIEKVITVTITGTNDLPTVNADSVFAGAVTEAAAGDDALTTKGKVTFDDVDTGDTITYSIRYTDANGDEQTIVVDNNFPLDGIKTEYGTIIFDAATGEWTFVLDDEASNSKVNGLDNGQKVNGGFVVIGTDSAGGKKEQVVTVTITGTNEAPVLEVSDSTDTVVWSGNGASAVDTTITDPDTIGVYIHESNNAGFIQGTLVASDSNIDDGDAHGADKYNFKVGGDTPITVTHPDGSITTYASIAEFNAGNIYGATLTLDSATGKWTFKTDRTNENFLGLKFDEFLNIKIGVIVEDGQGGSDSKNINIKIEGGQQDLNFIHEYGDSNILEWIQLEVNSEITGSEVVDYNEDGLGSGASIKSITLPQGTTEWSITAGLGTWTLTHTGGYSVTINANGSASFSGNLPKGAIIDLPIVVTVTDGSTERTFNGTKVITTDHQETGTFFTSDGSKEAEVVMDYQTYVTDNVTSSSEGSVSSANLANARISAINGGRTYLHIFGHSNGGATNFNNTLDIATTSGATAAAITVAGMNSFLFLEVRADNPEASGAGADTINLGKGNVAIGTKGVAIELEGGSSSHSGDTDNTINMDEWKFGGQYNYISIIGDSEKAPGTYGNLKINNTISLKDQTFTGGESFFKAIGAGIYEKGAELTGNFTTGSLATMKFETFLSTGNAKTNVFLASTLVGGVDRGTQGLSLIRSDIAGAAIIAEGSSVARYSIAPIYGDVVAGNLTAVQGNSASTYRYSVNELTIDKIQTLGEGSLVVDIAGLNVGNLTTNSVQPTENLITIKEIDASGKELTFNLSGIATGNIIGRTNDNNPLNNSSSQQLQYDTMTIEKVTVAAGSKLNMNIFTISGGNTEHWGGHNSQNVDYHFTFGEIKGIANINIATFGGDVYDFANNYPMIFRLKDLTTSNNAKLDMNVAADALGYSTVFDTNDSGVFLEGTFDLTGLEADDPDNKYGVEIAVNSMHNHVVNSDNGTGAFAVDKGYVIAWDQNGNATHTAKGGNILTNSAEDFIVYGAAKTYDGEDVKGVLNANTASRIGYFALAASTLEEDGNITVYGDYKTISGSRNLWGVSNNNNLDVIALGKGDDVVYSDFGHDKADTSGYKGQISYSGDTIYLGGGSDTAYAGVGVEVWHADSTGRVNYPNDGASVGSVENQNRVGDKDVMYVKGNWTNGWDGNNNLNGHRTQNFVIDDNGRDATGVDYNGTSQISGNGFEEVHFDDVSFAWDGSSWSQM